MTGGLLVLAPLGIEARAVAGGTRRARIERVGVGPRRAAAAATRLRVVPAANAGPAHPGPASPTDGDPTHGDLTDGGPDAIAVMGVGGGLVAGLVPGELVVADRVLRPDGTVVCEPAGAALLAGALQRAGLAARVGAVVTTPRPVRGAAAREILAATGATVADMETSALLEESWGRPTAVIRAVSDLPGQELVSVGTVANGAKALRSLRAAGPVVEAWADACRRRTVVLASPRSFCAGVERAIATVDAAIDRFGPPVYVRRQIVHNDYVVADLETRGAVFVREIDEVPAGATVVFSAHGVAVAVRSEAAAKGLRVIDATCPLVAKVHSEVRRFAQRDRELVLIGHAGHDEVEGTLGEVEGIRLVESPDQVADLDLDSTARVAFATQTTLAPDEVEATVAALKARFPDLEGPRGSDICYATHNRQEAVKDIAADCDLVLVVGSATSSNSRRLVEVADRSGCRAELIDDESDLRIEWLSAASRIGITAGASAPDFLVHRIVDALRGLGPLDLDRRPVRAEAVSFSLPQEVR